MRKKKITETVPAGPLDDLPEKIVSDEDPEDDEDDDSEEAGEAEEPDEEKHSSSSREEHCFSDIGASPQVLKSSRWRPQRQYSRRTFQRSGSAARSGR